MDLSDIKKIYIGDKEVWSIALGATPVWPVLDKPVVSVEHLQSVVPNYMLGVSWTWPAGATECWVFVDGNKVAEVTESWDQGEHGYWEGGEYAYGSTHDVYIIAYSFSGEGHSGEPRAARRSDTVTYTITDPAFVGTTFTFQLIASVDNVPDLMPEPTNNIKLYACFTSANWPSSSHRQQYLAKYDNMADPSISFYFPFEYATPDSLVERSSIEKSISPIIMNDVGVDEAEITPLDGTKTRFANVLLLEENFLGDADNIFGWTPGNPIVQSFAFWQLDSTKYRFYPANARGGLEYECPEKV